jgi:hypothetical protein
VTYTARKEITTAARYPLVMISLRKFVASAKASDFYSVNLQFESWPGHEYPQIRVFQLSYKFGASAPNDVTNFSVNYAHYTCMRRYIILVDVSQVIHT